jgi:hypothetical protein
LLKEDSVTDLWTRRAFTFALVALALCVAGCESKPTHESVTQETIDKMEEMVEVLKGIKDEASAKAARPKMEQIKKDMDEIKAKSKALGEPPADVKQKLAEKHKQELEKVTGEMMKEMMRIGFDPKIAPHLKDTLPSMK